MKPLISIIMSVKDGSKYLSKSIESILDQTLKNFEFIIINDGSKDDSLHIIEEYAKKNNRIKIIDNKQNIGLTRSLNKAIKLAKGDYIARQDADDISVPTRLEKELKYLEDNKLHLVGSFASLINEENKIIGKIGKDTKQEDIYKKLIRGTNSLIHGSIMFTKEMISKMEGYDSFFEFAQDYELYLRLIKNKFRLGIIPKHLYSLRMHQQSITVKKFKKQRFYVVCAKYNNELENTKNNFRYANGDIDKVLSSASNQMRFEYYLRLSWFYLFTLKEAKKARKILVKQRVMCLKAIPLFLASLFPMRLMQIIPALRKKLLFNKK